MSEGGKKTSNYLCLLSSLFGAPRMAKILFKQHFDTNAGAIDWDSNTGEYQYGGTSNYKYNLEYSIIRR